MSDSLNGRIEALYDKLEEKDFEEGLRLSDEILAGDRRAFAGFYGKAFALRCLGRLDEAEDVVAEGVIEYPDSPYLLNEAGLILYQGGDYAKALERFEESLEKNPEKNPKKNRPCEKAWSWKVACLRRREELNEAEAVVKKGLEFHPASPDLRIEKAFIHYQRRDWKGALKEFGLLGGDAESETVLAWTAACYRMLGKLDEAEATVIKGLGGSPASAELLNEQAFISYDREDWGAALRGFEKVLKVAPANETALGYRVACYRMLRDFETAQEMVDRALEAQQGSPRLLNEKAFISYDQGEWEVALKGFRETLAVQSDNENALAWSVSCYRLLRDFQAALDAVEQAIVKRPRSVRLLNEQAFISYDRGDWGSALEGFQKALNMDRYNEKAWTWTVNCYRMLRKFNDAQIAVDSAPEELSRGPALLNARALVSYDQEEWKKALEVFGNALKGAPRNEMALAWTITCHRMLRDFRSAQEQVEKALEILPKSPRLLNEQAFIFFDQGRWEEALEGFHNVLAEDPQNEVALAWKGLCCRRLGDIVAAVHAMRDAVKRQPRSGVVHFMRGLAFLEEGDFSKAEEAFGKSAEFRPDWHEPVFRLAKLCARGGRVSEALNLLKRRRREYPGDPLTIEALGFYSLHIRDFDWARRAFDSILWLDAKNKEVIARAGRGAEMLCRGRPREAAEVFNKLAQENPHRLVFRTNHARALVHVGGKAELRKAQDICEGVIDVDPANTEAFATLGVIHYKRAHWCDAEECLCRAVRLNPGEGPYRELGALYAAQGCYDEAETHLRRAIEISKFETGAYLELGSLYFKMDRKADAMDMLRRAVASDRKSAVAIQALALSCCREGRFSEAQELLLDGIKRLPREECVGLCTELARLLRRLGSKAGDRVLLEEALQHATKAVEWGPEKAAGYFQQGMAFCDLGSYADAVDSFEKCRQLDPDNLEARRNIHRLKEPVFMQRQARRLELAGIGIVVVSAVLFLVLLGLWLRLSLQSGAVFTPEGGTVHSLVNWAVGSNPNGSGEAAPAKEQTVKEGITQADLKIDQGMLLTVAKVLLVMTVLGVLLLYVKRFKPYVRGFKAFGLEVGLQQVEEPMGARSVSEVLEDEGCLRASPVMIPETGALGGGPALRGSRGGPADSGAPGGDTRKPDPPKARR